MLLNPTGQEGKVKVTFDPTNESNSKIQDLYKIVSKERNKRWLRLAKKLNQRKSKDESTWKKCRVKEKEALEVILSNSPKNLINGLQYLITNPVNQ